MLNRISIKVSAELGQCYQVQKDNSASGCFRFCYLGQHSAKLDSSYQN